MVEDAPAVKDVSIVKQVSTVKHVSLPSMFPVSRMLLLLIFFHCSRCFRCHGVFRYGGCSAVEAIATVMDDKLAMGRPAAVLCTAYLSR